jgi:heme A synthase
MTALPLVAEAVLAAVLVLSLGRAFFGSPPPRPDPLAAAAWMAAGVLLLACVLLAGGTTHARELLAAAGVEAVCVAGWWLRARDDEGEAQPDGDPPVDWDEFDRLRDRWPAPRRPRELV